MIPSATSTRPRRRVPAEWLDPDGRINLDKTPAGRRWLMRRYVIDGEGNAPAQPELPPALMVIEGGRSSDRKQPVRHA